MVKTQPNQRLDELLLRMTPEQITSLKTKFYQEPTETAVAEEAPVQVASSPKSSMEDIENELEELDF